MSDDNQACDLRSKKCAACTAKTPRLTDEQSKDLLQKSLPKWKLGSDGGTGNRWLYREIGFKSFAEALGFVTMVGIVAEEENHHPDFELYRYRYVHFRISTHAIHGLSENDFILAAKIDELAEALGL